MARASTPAVREQAAAPAKNERPKEKLDIKAMLENSSERLAAALPKHMTPARITQVVSTLVFRTPKLQDCHPHTIFASVLRACSLGLDLEPAMNEAFLIPRWNKDAGVNECQFQPGYQGLRKLACQSGQVAFIHARLVRANDHFQYAFDPDLVFSHIPNDGNAPVTQVYAYAKLATGDQLIEVMTPEEVEAIRARSQSAKFGPWVTDWNEMAKKTVIKRLCKSLPRSLELAQAIEADDEDYHGDGHEPDRPRVTGRGNAGLMQRLAPARPQAEPEFTVEQGVSRPTYSEAETSQAPYVDDDDDETTGDPAPGK